MLREWCNLNGVYMKVGKHHIGLSKDGFKIYIPIEEFYKNEPNCLIKIKEFFMELI